MPTQPNNNNNNNNNESESVKPSFNPSKVAALLKQGLPIINQSQNQLLALMIGRSGAGKTTLIAYQLGHQIIKKRLKNRAWVYDTIEPVKGLSIGHGGSAKTLYASSHTMPHLGWSYTDCPGFNGIRPIEERIVESVGTEIAIKLSQGIGAILIALPFGDITNTRLGNLKDIIVTLNHLFENPKAIFKEAIFVITQKSNSPNLDPEERQEDIDQIVGKLDTAIETCKNMLEQINNNPKTEFSDNDLNKEELHAIISLAEILKNRELDIILADDLLNVNINENSTKRLIEKRIQTQITNQKIIQYEAFNFSDYDEYRTKFNNAIFELMDFYISMMKDIQNFYSKIQDRLIEKKEIETKNDGMLRDIEACKSYTSNEENAQNNQQNHNKSIDYLKQKIKKNRNDIKSLNESIQKNNTELEKINTDEPELHWKPPQFASSVSWFKPLGWVEHKFTYPHDEPILSIEKEKKNGEWKEETQNYQGTKQYSIKFQSNYYANANASVKGYIKRKDKRDNALRITRLNLDNERLKERVQEKINQISECEEEIENKNAKSLLQEKSATDGKAGREALINDKNNNIKSNLEEIEQLQRRIEEIQEEACMKMNLVEGYYKVCLLKKKPDESDIKPQILYLYALDGELSIAAFNSQLDGPEYITLFNENILFSSEKSTNENNSNNNSSSNINDPNNNNSSDVTDVLNKKDYHEILNLINEESQTTLPKYLEQKILHLAAEHGYGDMLSMIFELDNILKFHSSLMTYLQTMYDEYKQSKSKYEEIFNKNVEYDNDILKEWKKNQSREQASKNTLHSTFYSPKTTKTTITEVQQELDELETIKIQLIAELARIDLRINNRLSEFIDLKKSYSDTATTDSNPPKTSQNKAESNNQDTHSKNTSQQPTSQNDQRMTDHFAHNVFKRNSAENSNSSDTSTNIAELNRQATKAKGKLQQLINQSNQHIYNDFEENRIVISFSSRKLAEQMITALAGVSEHYNKKEIKTLNTNNHNDNSDTIYEIELSSIEYKDIFGEEAFESLLSSNTTSNSL